MLRSKSRERRKQRLKRGIKHDLPSNIATKSIAPFPRYPPASWVCIFSYTNLYINATGSVSKSLIGIEIINDWVADIAKRHSPLFLIGIKKDYSICNSALFRATRRTII
jgi:hypothetical protein